MELWLQAIRFLFFLHFTTALHWHLVSCIESAVLRILKLGNAFVAMVPHQTKAACICPLGVKRLFIVSFILNVGGYLGGNAY